jgi:tRNA(Ile2)-agmatinylcytidine synthase
MLTIGVDDTDSDRGLCTTYLAAVLMGRLEKLGVVVGLPRLARLNPCAKFKTRGNAAVAISIEADDPESVKDLAFRTLLEFSDLESQNTNPGLVIAERITPRMKDFYRRAVTQILEIDCAKQIIREEGLWARGLKAERGLIGALAAVGAEFQDYTYELIAYRQRSRWGTPRQIEPSSVWRAEHLTYLGTWDTVDYGNSRIVFAPHSPDPILFGIRGDSVEAIQDAFSRIRCEPPERTVLYLTNQGTDAHILNGDEVDVVEDQSYRLQGMVISQPEAIEKGHLFFRFRSSSTGKDLTCAAFEPTKGFRGIVRKLVPGDLVEVYGAVVNGTLNLEKLKLVRKASVTSTRAPLCPSCGKRMKSAGQAQGYRCRRCKTKVLAQEIRVVDRDLEEGFYEVPPSARRHLAKPLVRFRDSSAHPSR